MAQYIDKSAVVAEIEKRKSQFMSQADSFHKLGMEEKRDHFVVLASNMQSLLSFFDTLEVKEVDLELNSFEAISIAIDALKEKHVIKELEEDKCEGCNNIRGCLNCVDGDQWAHYEVNKELEEEAEEYVFGFHPSIQRMCKEAFIDGAKWQKEQEYTCYEEAFEDGCKWQKKQMITRAIAWVEWNNRNGSCLFDGWKESLMEAMKGE